MSYFKQLKLVVCTTLLLALSVSSLAKAVTLDVNANWEYWRYNYEPMSFASGTYKITPIGVAGGGLYNAWNAWGPGEVAGCDAAGMCSRGYINSYSFGYVGANDFIYEIATIGGSVVAGTALAFETPLLALANAESYVISLTQPAKLYFYLKDGENWYYDNSGGMSFSIQAVPEPESYALMLAGLGILGVVAGRRRYA